MCVKGLSARFVPTRKRRSCSRSEERRVGKECIGEFSDVPVSVCADVREGVERALRSDAEAAVVFGSLTLFRELVRP